MQRKTEKEAIISSTRPKHNIMVAPIVQGNELQNLVSRTDTQLKVQGKEAHLASRPDTTN